MAGSDSAISMTMRSEPGADGRLHVSSASLGIPYKLIYGISPYACALMIVSYLLNRYLPGSVREPDAGAAGREGEVTAQ